MDTLRRSRTNCIVPVTGSMLDNSSGRPVPSFPEHDVTEYGAVCSIVEPMLCPVTQGLPPVDEGAKKYCFRSSTHHGSAKSSAFVPDELYGRIYVELQDSWHVL